MNIRHLLAGPAIASLLLSPSCSKDDSTQPKAEDPRNGAGAAEVLRFSAIPDQAVTEQAAKYRGFADHLAKALGVKTEFIPASDYAASVTKFVNGEIQLAWFGGLTGVQARAEVEGARAIAQGVEDPNFRSYFIANASTGLEHSDDFPAAIKELKFTFGDRNSTSGRLMPSYFITEMGGAAPDAWFSHSVGFSGAHDRTAKLVETGDAWQAGVLSYTSYDKMVAEGKLDPRKCRIIWKTPSYADYNWTAHPSLEMTFGAGFIDRLQQALIAIEDPELLEVLQRSGLVAAKNEDFEGIAVVARQLKLLNE
jgi:phosphonate transport system substrate-binding protein